MSKKEKTKKSTEDEVSETKNDSQTQIAHNSKFSQFINFYKNNFVALVCVKLIALGILIRIFVMKSSLGAIDENESLSLLMGKDVLNGRLSAFRYSHHFSGTIENLIISPIVGIFGMSGIATRLVPTIFLVATSFVLWRAFEHTPYKDTMRIVMGCLWIWTGYFIYTTTKLTGFSSALIFLEVAALASAYYAAHSLRNLRYFYLWALVSGLLFWTYSSTLWMLTLPSAYWILRSSPALKKYKFQAVGLFIIASLPAIVASGIDKFLPVINTFDKSAGKISNGSTDSFSAFLQLVGIRTFTGNSVITSFISVPSIIVFGICVIAFVAISLLSIYRITKLKKTDFAQLQILILAVTLISTVLFFITSRQVTTSIFICAVIPMIFVCVDKGRENLIKFGVVTFCLFVIGLFSLTTSTRDFQTNENQVKQATNALNKMKVKNAIAPHEFAYPIIVESENKITTTPFDGNNFDQKRSGNVHQKIQAIVVDSENKSQNNLAYCVQGYFGSAFERTDTGDVFIYSVEKDLQSKIWTVVEKCNDVEK